MLLGLVPPHETREARDRLRACLAEEREVVHCKEAAEQVLTPAHRALVLELLSERLTGLERWEEAQEADQELAKLRPEDGGARMRLGERMLYLFGRTADALETFREASALRPQDPRPPALEGIALNLLGRFAESQTAFGEATRRDQDFFATHPAAGLVAEASGRGEKWPVQAAAVPSEAP